MKFTTNSRLSIFILFLFAVETAVYGQELEEDSVATRADYGIKSPVKEWTSITGFTDNTQADTAVYRFDSMGRLTFCKNSEGSRSFVFDTKGRLKHFKRLNKENGLIHETSYSYTDSSRLIKDHWQDRKEKVTFTVFKNGQIIRETVNDGREMVNVYIFKSPSLNYWRTMKDAAGTVYEKEHRFYDSEGRLEEKKIESSLRFEDIEIEKRSYHNNGRIKVLEQFTDASGNGTTTVTTYDSLGRVIRVLEDSYMPLGSHEIHDTTRYEYSLNEKGTIIVKKMIPSKGSITEIKYAYYPNGELKEEDEYYDGKLIKWILYSYR